MSDWIMREFFGELILDGEQLHELHNRFCAEFCKGLSASSNASIKCYATYVQDLPTGHESGRYLALDLAGSSFRVLMIELRGKSEMQIVSEAYSLSEKIMAGTGTELFDYLASCLNEFVVKHGLEKMRLPLAFTFAFPCAQIGLTKAFLMRWTKGFNCSGVVNKDVGRLMRDAINRRKVLKIDLVAVLNNTTGTLVSCARSHPSCRIGLLVSTGCNACYMENVANVEKLDKQYKDKPNVIVNTEWGAFGEQGALDMVRTGYDETIDRNSINKGKQLFEKMVGGALQETPILRPQNPLRNVCCFLIIAGMYLGSLVRVAFLRAVHENLMFKNSSHKNLITDVLMRKRNALETKVLYEVDTDTGPEYVNVRKYFKEKFHINEVSKQDCERFKMICDIVARRSGLLVGTGLAALVNRIGLPEVTVGVDGSVYRHHPSYDGYIREAMDKLVKPQYKYNITLAEDGAGRGAALLAAVVSAQAKK